MNPTERTVLDDIIALARQWAEVEITPQSRLASDLGLDGDDAHAFLTAFAARHDVDLSGLRWLRYFGDEGFDPFTPTLFAVASAVSPGFRARWRAARAAEREITIAHLAAVADAKHWLEPDLRPPPPSPAGRAMTSAFSLLATIMALAWPALAAALVLDALARGDTSIAGDRTGFVTLLLFGALAFAWMFYNSWRNIRRKLDSA